MTNEPLAVTEYSPEQPLIGLTLDSENRPNEEDDYSHPLEPLLKLLKNSPKVDQRVNILAAHHITMGKWYLTHADYQAHLDEFLPEESTGDDLWLKVL